MKEYLRSLVEHLSAGDSTEHTHRGALEALLYKMVDKLQISNEPKRIKVGAPDLVVRKIIARDELLPVGYIETKDIGEDLGKVEKSEQIERYLQLPNLILTDYLEFRWYVKGEKRRIVRIGEKSGRKIKPIKGGEEELIELFKSFLAQDVTDISNPKELAARMAGLCKNIDRIINQTFAEGSASELMRDLKSAFERTLLPDITDAQFADMFAQTLGYGLFAARIQHAENKPGEPFVRTGAAREIPKSNPFLRDLFYTIHSPDLEDEPFIGFVDDLTAVLAHTDIGAVLAHFGKRTKQEDPILHFYETFLSEYDPKERKLRGVYYTPEPVVSYIVRSVDFLLKEKFGLVGGLADETMIEVEVKEGGKFVKRRLPKVLILDPACGTGTFLYAVVDLIRQRFIEQNRGGEWQSYVREQLIPRLYGFELQMAPYAVAHLKLAMQLAGHDLTEVQRQKWGYTFGKDERLNIFLTNSLEYTEEKIQMEFGFIERAIAQEARAAQAIKGELPIMVVMGNPPYSMFGKVNEGTWILSLEADYKTGADFKKWNRDDYIKFIRFGQWRIDRSKQGVLAFITNNGYFTDKTRNGMRQSLLGSFDNLFILDLHGSVKRGKVAKAEHNDQNVFDIGQGVGIGIFAKTSVGTSSSIRFQEVLGDRQTKYKYLLGNDMSTTAWTKIDVSPPACLFRESKTAFQAEYNNGLDISTIFEVAGPGVKTERDSISLHMTSHDIRSVVEDFRLLSEAEIAVKYGTEDSRDWKILKAKEDVRQSRGASCYRRILYRPFDTRFTWYSGKTRGFIGTPNFPVMQQVLLGNNIFLGTVRNVETDGSWCHVFCTADLAQHHSVSLKEGNQFFPLYLYAHDGSFRKPNLSLSHVEEFARKLGLTFVEEGARWTQKSSGSTAAATVDSEVGPEDVFYYIYAILHSPTYRLRYKELLKMDFPRVPLTSNLELFGKLVPLGYELVQYHLLEHPNLENTPIRFSERGSDQVDKVEYREVVKRVHINKTQYFESVGAATWNFHVGGYHVCQKWLKDRTKRNLSHDDIRHYEKTVMALAETIRLMKEVDAAIPKWPIE